MEDVYLILGSNLGFREAYLENALHAIELALGPIAAKSGIYTTAAWGDLSQPDYLNVVVKLRPKAAIGPLETMQVLLEIEEKMGRVRQPENQNAARTIDIDLLFFGDRCIATQELTVPHPRLHQRKFVLEPFCEVAPYFEKKYG